MSEAVDLAALIDELDAIEDLRDESGTLTPEHAARRQHIERQLMAALTSAIADEERRKHLRVPCQLVVRLHYQGSAVSGTVRDAGAGGVLVESPLVPEIGEMLEVEIPRRAGVLEHGLRVKGTVKWRQETGVGTRGIGIAFELGEEGHERRLRRFVLELLRRRRKS